MEEQGLALRLSAQGVLEDMDKVVMVTAVPLPQDGEIADTVDLVVNQDKVTLDPAKVVIMAAAVVIRPKVVMQLFR